MELSDTHPIARAGVIIDTRRKMVGRTDDVPIPLTADERYEDWMRKRIAAIGRPAGNSINWAWRGRKRKTFLDMKPKARKKYLKEISK